ncbi:MAG: flavodoxin-dependent (E)-4-hydroxy-3-methylbut-2-enyl-diphosphate synthase, partial [Ferruginibacter sp.]
TIKPFYDPFNYSRRVSHAVSNIGTGHVPVVIADFMQAESINPEDLDSIGYRYINKTDKWHVADAAADIIYTGSKMPQGSFPSNLGIIVDADAWHNSSPGKNVYPLYQAGNYSHEGNEKAAAVFVAIDANAEYTDVLQKSREHSNIVYCIYANGVNSVQAIRRFFIALHQLEITHPVVLAAESHHEGIDEQLIHFSIETGALFLDGMGDGIWLMNDPSKITNAVTTGRTNLVNNNNHQFLNNTAFSILQAVRTRISKTEYISCPSCGRTLFDLQETTTRIRSVTQHLKGLKIAVMGCIVNGPGEMADADFGYVGSGPGKITLYKGKEVMQRNINSEVAVDELINLLKANDCWIEPA